MSFEINIKENGISVLTLTQLYDSEGNPVASSRHRKAIGLGDYPDEASYIAAIEGFMEPTLGASFSNLVAINAAKQGKIDQLEAEKAQIALEKSAAETTLSNLQAERDQLAAEVNQRIQEVTDAQAVIASKEIEIQEARRGNQGNVA